MSRESGRTRASVANLDPRFEEKRRHPRRPATGSVQLLLEDPGLIEVSGLLIDVSRGGFRAAHSHSGLANGQIVRFRHEAGEGFARVVWNRISGREVQTGFLIL
jgi:hypothetical protein